MIFEYQTDLDTLDACLPQFLQLTGASGWAKRTHQLATELCKSPYRAKIVLDYHWLEVALSEHIAGFGHNGLTGQTQITIELFSALLFAQTAVSVHSRLSAVGRKKLEGRLQSALRAETGFAPIYVEMSLARRLSDAGYEVEFSDLEGLAQFDLRFWKGGTEGEVECKSLSCDAGRKIHRKDFYRFMNTIADLLQPRATSGATEVLLITLQDRMPASHSSQGAMRQAVREVLSRPTLETIQGDFFTVALQPMDPRLVAELVTGQRVDYGACQDIYGQNCHVSGAFGPAGACLVVMRSQRPDDTSAEVLDAMKKATSQFSRTRPAFIAVQYEDIEPSDLLSRSLRRRAALLSYYLFHRHEASHVVAANFSAYRGLVVGEGGVGEPSFSVPNPSAQNATASGYAPLLAQIPDAEFAVLLGELPPPESLSMIPIDRSEDG